MTYNSLHRWVERQLGKPMLCSKCGNTELSTYHWSNISGEYKQDLSDWQRLCVSCHKNYDYALRVSKGLPRKTVKEYCKSGHELSGNNIRIRMIRNLPNRVCIECQRGYLRNYRYRLLQITISERK